MFTTALSHRWELPKTLSLLYLTPWQVGMGPELLAAVEKAEHMAAEAQKAAATVTRLMTRHTQATRVTREAQASAG